MRLAGCSYESCWTSGVRHHFPIIISFYFLEQHHNRSCVMCVCVPLCDLIPYTVTVRQNCGKECRHTHKEYPPSLGHDGHDDDDDDVDVDVGTISPTQLTTWTVHRADRRRAQFPGAIVVQVASTASLICVVESHPAGPPSCHALHAWATAHWLAWTSCSCPHFNSPYFDCSPPMTKG